MVSFWQQVRRLVYRNRSQVHAPSGRGPSPNAPGCGRMVLVVDLDGRAGQPLGPTLERSGFETYVAGQDVAALELLGRTAPAVVVVAGAADVNFYRALRRATPVPILAIDPRADDEHVLAAFAAGVDQFQSGPTGSDEVVARIVALLRRAH